MTLSLKIPKKVLQNVPKMNYIKALVNGPVPWDALWLTSRVGVHWGARAAATCASW